MNTSGVSAEYMSYTHPNTNDNTHARMYAYAHRNDVVRKCAGCYIICDSVQCVGCGMKYCSVDCRNKHAAVHVDVCKIRSGVYGLTGHVPKPNGAEPSEATTGVFPIETHSNTVSDPVSLTANRAFLSAVAAVHGRFDTNGRGCGCLVVHSRVHDVGTPTRRYYYGTFLYVESANKLPYADATPGSDTTVVVVEHGGKKINRRVMIDPEECLRAYLKMITNGINMDLFYVGEPMGFVCDSIDYMEFCDADEVLERLRVVGA